MPDKLPVVAAIPNYNMAESLARLLPQVLAQKYDRVYVLDDASTDNSKEIVASYGSRITFVAGENNLCSGGNRNRILNHLTVNSIIHFLDADIELVSDNIPSIIQRLVPQHDKAIIGGLVARPDGTQLAWNFGPRFSLYGTLSAILQSILEIPKHRKTAPFWRRIVPYLLNVWADPTKTPVRRTTYWVHEANMIITSDSLARIGGFETAIRSHDTIGLSLKSQKAGIITIFDPSIAVTQHNDKNVRPGRRRTARRRASFYLLRKYGLWSWFLPNGRFKPRHNEL